MELTEANEKLNEENEELKQEIKNVKLYYSKKSKS